MIRSPPNLHTMVHTWSYIQGVLKVKVKVKGHVIRTLFHITQKSLLLPHTTRSPPNLHTIVPIRARIQDVLKVNVKLKGHVIRTLTVMSRNVCYTVPSDILSLHAFTLWSTVTLSFQYKCQAATCIVHIMEWGTPSLTVWFKRSLLQIKENSTRELAMQVVFPSMLTITAQFRSNSLQKYKQIKWHLLRIGHRF